MAHLPDLLISLGKGLSVCQYFTPPVHAVLCTAMAQDGTQPTVPLFLFYTGKCVRVQGGAFTFFPVTCAPFPLKHPSSQARLEVRCPNPELDPDYLLIHLKSSPGITRSISHKVSGVSHPTWWLPCLSSQEQDKPARCPEFM